MNRTKNERETKKIDVKEKKRINRKKERKKKRKKERKKERKNRLIVYIVLNRRREKFEGKYNMKF